MSMSYSTLAANEGNEREGYAFTLAAYPSRNVQDTTSWHKPVTALLPTRRERVLQPHFQLQPPRWSGHPYAPISHAIAFHRGAVPVFPSTATNLATSDGPALNAGVRRPVGNPARH